MKFT
jgi:hypothetical protein